ncbi:hypothetical protein BDR26DRAFT_858616 [Obelidium mucronatum]|nr:hypothetical protein BDR26DRAFT_858616 [Obelidium mucronatum]
MARLYFHLLLLAAAYAAAQTCAPMGGADPYCGFLAPLDSAFAATGPTSATATLNQFMPLLAVCGGLNITLAPLLYCLGAAGPCNGAAWSLPADPLNMTLNAQFFNAIKFADVSPALAKAGRKPLCLDACTALTKPIVNCGALALIGVKSTSDPCAGLTNSDCVALPGDASGKTLTWTAAGGVPFVPPSASASASATTAAPTKTGASTAAAQLSGLGIVLIALTMF